jgi:hypothetical protein
MGYKMHILKKKPKNGAALQGNRTQNSPKIIGAVH